MISTENFEKDVEHCLAVLRQGGTILYPTDTVWGIGCDATDAAAVERIYALKQRPGTKSMIVLLSEDRELLRYVAHPDLQVFDYLNSVEKPTTVIYEGAIGLAENVIGEDGTIAIRIVKDAFCRHIIKRLRKPLVSTSANISGEPSPRFFSDISAEIKQGVDYIVQYRQDDLRPSLPSSVVRWNKAGDITVIRP
jgi:L-threonylcarbamoyladenylate synthase